MTPNYVSNAGNVRAHHAVASGLVLVGDPEVKQTLLSPVPVGRKNPISLKIAGQDFEFPIAKA